MAKPPCLRAGQQVSVRRQKAGKAELFYPMEVSADDGDHIVVVGPYSASGPEDFGYATFGPDDLFIEHFWRSRWFAIAEAHGRGGLKGWYCDVARPAVVHGKEIVSVDLYLDVWVPSAGDAIVTLDEDEFAASGLHSADAAAHTSALRALNELLTLAPRKFESLLDLPGRGD